MLFHGYLDNVVTVDAQSEDEARAKIAHELLRIIRSRQRAEIYIELDSTLDIDDLAVAG